MAENKTIRFPGDPGRDDSPPAASPDEVQLMIAIRTGSQQALATLYRNRGSLVYSMLVRMLVNEMEAQEVMQDTFVQIWRRAREFNSQRSSPVAWILMIARGLALDRLRARSRRLRTLAAYEQEVASLEVEIGLRQPERDELAAACTAALHQLPEPQGHALQLAFFRGWTHEEIAGAVGEPLGTIKARIRRGLLSLRKALKGYHD